MADDPSPETIAFLFDLAKGAPAEAMDQIKSLQARVASCFAAATVLVGFGALVALPVTGSHLSGATTGALIAAGVAYVLAAAIGVWTLRPAKVLGLPDPPALRCDYQKYTPNETMGVFLEALARDAPTNAKYVQTASDAVVRTLVLVFAEGLAMALAILFSHVT